MWICCCFLKYDISVCFADIRPYYLQNSNFGTWKQLAWTKCIDISLPKIFFYCRCVTNKGFNFTYILEVSRSQRGASDKWGKHCRMLSQNCLLDWTTGKLVILWVVYFCTLILKHWVGLFMKFPFMCCYKQIIGQNYS